MAASGHTDSVRPLSEGVPPTDCPLTRATLFYDADCRLCRWTVAKVAAWDRRAALRLVPLQDTAEADRLLGAMDQQTRMASWHLVTSDGTVHSRGRGVAPLLQTLPGGSPGAWMAGAAQPLTDLAYRFVADHRSGLGKLVPRGARERADDRLRRRMSGAGG
jgi:predicted DCC family thiol-disulfide oxidoreductase YuxK